MDLTFYYQYEAINDGYESIVNFIEITTRKAYCYPVRSKLQEEIFSVFIQFLKDIDNKLFRLEMDKGSEFNKVISYCDDNNIQTIVSPNDSTAMSTVERFNRSLRNYINKVCPLGSKYLSFSYFH